MNKYFYQAAKIIIVTGIIFTTASYSSTFAADWVGPTAPPPGNNKDAPINTGFFSQSKDGTIWIDGITEEGLAAYSSLIVNNGRVSIGTTNDIPSWAKLQVNTTGSKGIHTMDSTYGGLLIGYQGPTIQGRGTDNGNTAPLALQPWGGNLGVGISTPQTKFHVRVTTNSNLLVRPGSDFGVGYSGVAIDSLNDAYDTRTMTVIAGTPTVFPGGSVGIGMAAPTATLDVARGTAPNGTAIFRGTTNTSHFNYSTTEDTYIRGGKAGSQVIINDASSGNTVIGTGGGNVGVGTASPASKLDVLGDVCSTVGGVRKCLQLDTTSHWTANGTSIYNNNVGKVGIGTNNPSSKLTIMDTVNGLPTGIQIAPYHTPGVAAGTIINANDEAGTVRSLVLQSNGGSVGVGLTTPTATLDVVRGTAPYGTALFRGSTWASHFNYSSTEDTYIRGGNTGSKVFINDAHAGNVIIGNGGGNVGIGTGAPQNKLDVNGGISLAGVAAIDGVNSTGAGPGWYRSYGTSGWYNGTYGGGIWMADSTWVRVYNNKNFWVDQTIGANGGLTVGYGGIASPVGGALFGGQVAIGTTVPTSNLSLTVNGPVGASAYCDQNGQNCKSPTSLGGFPAPDWDSGWQGRPAAGHGDIAHNLGTSNTMVYMETYYPGSQPGGGEYYWEGVGLAGGSDQYNISGSNNAYTGSGVYWSRKTNTTIHVVWFGTDSPYVRIRMWKF